MTNLHDHEHHKPAKSDQSSNDLSLDDIKIALIVVASIVGLGLVSVFFYKMLEDVGPPHPVDVTVTLVNRCDLPDDVFMVKAMPSGPSAGFDSKKARLRAMSNQRLKLMANAKYPGFNFEGAEEDVAPEVTLIATCSVSERLESTTREMRKQFGN